MDSADAFIAFDPVALAWEIGSQGIRRRMRFDPVTGIALTGLANTQSGQEWAASGPASSDLELDSPGPNFLAARDPFIFLGQHSLAHSDGSLELEISLRRGLLVSSLHYGVFPGVAVLEQWAVVQNTGRETARGLVGLASLSLSLDPGRDPLTLFWVQGANPPVPNSSDPQPLPTLRLRSVELPEGTSQEIGSSWRSSEESMGWFALAAPALGEGLFGGIEWSGAWRLRVGRANGSTALEAALEGVPRELRPGETFETPRRFFGFYRGDLDDAANVSHAFARSFLLRAHPPGFPWTQYNTWYAYDIGLDEVMLRREVDRAAELGLELFYIDAGWYEGSPPQGDFGLGLGTWRENPDKFPSGLAAFSDYVHGKGLKFGLWVEPERVDLRYAGPDRLVPLDWLAPEAQALAEQMDDLAGLEQARSGQLCLGRSAAREWTKQWLTRVIQDYKLDWLKWDNNLWMSCDPPGELTGGNYAHVQGLYAVLDYLRARFPDLVIEDCASGGNRMDYGLMRRTDIAWLSDNTEPSYRVRYHMAGASYPFPPEYLNTWLIDSPAEPLADNADPAAVRAWLRSRMMGAFGLSVRMQAWSPRLQAIVADEVRRFQGVRKVMGSGEMFRLLPQSDLSLPDLDPPAAADAVEFYSPANDTALVYLFQGATPWNRRRLVLKGLVPDTLYQVTLGDDNLTTRLTGRQLMSQGLRFRYEAGRPSLALLIQATPKSAGPSSNEAVPTIGP